MSIVGGGIPAALAKFGNEHIEDRKGSDFVRTEKETKMQVGSEVGGGICAAIGAVVGALLGGPAGAAIGGIAGGLIGSQSGEAISYSKQLKNEEAIYGRIFNNPLHDLTNSECGAAGGSNSLGSNLSVKLSGNLTVGVLSSSKAASNDSFIKPPISSSDHGDSLMTGLAEKVENRPKWLDASTLASAMKNSPSTMWYVARKFDGFVDHGRQQISGNGLFSTIFGGVLGVAGALAGKAAGGASGSAAGAIIGAAIGAGLGGGFGANMGCGIIAEIRDNVHLFKD
jgi:uncharacterized membrane protein